MTNQPRQRPWDEANAAPLPAEAGFSAWELWVWERVVRGELADLSRYPGAADDGDLEPANAANWPAHRVLSERFLRTILFHEPWATAPERPGVRIRGAIIREAVNWSARESHGEIWLDLCRFEQAVTLQDATICGLLSFEGTHFAESLDLERAFIKGGLLLSGIHAHGDIRMLGARVGGTLTFRAAVLHKPVKADRLDVGASMFFRDAIALDEIVMVGAIVRGQLSFVGSELRNFLQLEGIHVQGDLFLRGMKRLSTSSLIGAKIDLDLQLCGTFVDGDIVLTGTRIGGELHLEGPGVDPPIWSERSKLVLRNVECAALAGSLKSFQTERGKGKKRFVAMDLTGFKYQRMGGFGGDQGATLAEASSRDLVAWLDRATPADARFNPQPYRHLAATLTDAGYRNKSDDVMFALHHHELGASTTTFGRRLMLFFLWLFIGYGYRNFAAVVWFLGAVALGVVLGLGALGYDNTAPPAEVSRWGWFSFGNAIPLLTLDEAHKSFLADVFGARYLEVPPWLKSFFYLQKIFGFAMLSYLAAGLTGLAGRGRG